MPGSRKRTSSNFSAASVNLPSSRYIFPSSRSLLISSNLLIASLSVILAAFSLSRAASRALNPASSLTASMADSTALFSAISSFPTLRRRNISFLLRETFASIGRARSATTRTISGLYCVALTVAIPSTSKLRGALLKATPVISTTVLGGFLRVNDL